LFLIRGDMHIRIFFNAKLIKEGYARVIAPPFRYYDEFHNYQQEARAAGVGIWSTKAKR